MASSSFLLCPLLACWEWEGGSGQCFPSGAGRSLPGNSLPCFPHAGLLLGWGWCDRSSPCLPISGSASPTHVHTYAPAHSHVHTREHVHMRLHTHMSCSCPTRPCSPSPSKAVTLQVSTSPPGCCVSVRTDQLHLWAWHLPRLLGNIRQVPGPLQGSA